jgi:hypothetical protein
MALEPVSFYLGLLSAPFAQDAPVRAALISAMVAVSQSASALGFLSAWRDAHTSKGRSV